MPEIKRTWSIPTSPRSPYKLRAELELLVPFEGRLWDKATQSEYAGVLANSEVYEGSVPGNADLVARDRINRSPRTFGFVNLEDRKVSITSAGKRLLVASKPEELFTRQLLKWQYPSVKHSGRVYSKFNIKPFLELLRMSYELDGLSKREIATFLVPLIDFNNYNQTKEEIVAYRATLSQLRGPERRRYIVEAHLKKFRLVYSEELRTGQFTIRQQRGAEVSADKFIKTKMRNSIDYADAAIRYARSTGLFKLSATTFRLRIADGKDVIVKELLATTPREPRRFIDDKEGYLQYLEDPNTPLLPDDRVEVLQEEVRSLATAIRTRTTDLPDAVDDITHEKLVSATVSELKDIRDVLLKEQQTLAIERQADVIRSYALFDDIVEMYTKIINRADYDIPDKPLFFEWNTWRAFLMLNDGQIETNVRLDTEGRPLSTAPGGGADGVGYYEDFALGIEVTLMRGERQFEAEHESVPRHIGKLQKTLRDKGDGRPVYGIFIASGLNPATVANFYTIRNLTVSHYGGSARIIPLDLSDFVSMLHVAKDTGGIRSEQLHKFIRWADARADTAKDEKEWYLAIRERIPTWTNV